MDTSAIKLVLLDRDGVINFDSPDYIKTAAEWHPIPGALQGIAQLQQYVTVAVCTNQSGVGRGLFNEHTLAAIHAKMNAELTNAGGQPVDVFYCPHHPRAHCPCRKPRPALLQCAMQAYDVPPRATLYAGDSEKDLQAASNAACSGLLLLTGNGKETVRTLLGRKTTLRCSSLSELPGLLNFT